jgi:hypothetical protein
MDYLLQKQLLDGIHFMDLSMEHLAALGIYQEL